jgi:alpha-D-xyloside xylohydrolase
MRKGLLCTLWGCLVIALPQVQAARNQGGPFEKNPDGIIVHIPHPLPLYPHTLVVQAITAEIIHITAYPTEVIAGASSLIRVEGPGNPPRYEVRQKEDSLTFSTDSLNVTVSLTTGGVTFSDMRGRVLLQEAGRDQPPFAPDTAEGEHAWQVSSTFRSPENESLYGLGQQQNGFLDYKNKSVTLLQQNTSVAVPFLVSSRNYGLLWDNYSITRFGDLRPYEALSCLDLRGEDGQPGGLTAIYSSGVSAHGWGGSDSSTDLSSNFFGRRPESDISYAFLPDLAKLPKGYSLQNGLIRWKGTISAKTSGLHQFLLYSGGYARVWVDNKLVADRWRQCWNPATTPFDLNLEAGKPAKVTIEWLPDGGESFISLKCLPPGPSMYNNTYSFSSEVGDAINYYFVKGATADEVISGYRLLTGKAPIMPLWSMGLWQSRERYKTENELLSTVEDFRQRHIPLDNIVLDWQYWRPDQWGSHEFDPQRFPKPDSMLHLLHDSLHAHFMISVWPKFYVGTQNFHLFNDKGWLYTTSVDLGQKDWIGYVSTFYDAFNPDARRLFWQLMDQKLFTKGVDGWWMDATEPDILSNASISQRKSFMEPHALGTPSRYFNAFPLENARAVYEGQRSADPNQRVFILTRSAFAGQQRYSAATWSGDIGAQWSDMRNQITAGLNFSMSGIPYWTMDIGGFAVEHRYENPGPADLDEWRELNARWFQFGAFCPILRVHGQFPYREMFHIAPEDHPAYQSMLYYDRLRYRLLPYIYSVAARTWYDNYTIMRALVMDFGNDSIARRIPDQYMFGPSLLVNPVYTYKARTRKVYLPGGTLWYDAYSGAALAGGQWIASAAPYERMPLYIRAGSILPAGPALEYTGQRPADTITLYVYTGESGSFTLYEDQGSNYHYEQGQYATIPLTYDEPTHTLTVGERKGHFPGMLSDRVFQIVWISPGHPEGLHTETGQGTAVQYDGQILRVTRPEAG